MAYIGHNYQLKPFSTCVLSLKQENQKAEFGVFILSRNPLLHTKLFHTVTKYKMWPGQNSSDLCSVPYPPPFIYIDQEKEIQMDVVGD